MSNETEIKIPHEHLTRLEYLRGLKVEPGDVRDMLDDLIAAAQADQPPLPEGWVVLDGSDGGQYAYWHKGNRLYGGKGGHAYKIEATAESMRDRLTPLRPTVTEADVEKAAQAAAEESTAVSRDVWGAMPEGTQSLWRAVARAVFAVAEIEVEKT